MNYFETQSVWALVNLVLCVCIAWACICRLHRMSAKYARKDVRAAVALTITAAVASGLSPVLWQEFPGPGQVALAFAFLMLLVVGARDWKHGLPRFARSDNAPLEHPTTQF